MTVKKDGLRENGEGGRRPLFVPSDLQYVAAWALTAPLHVLPGRWRAGLLHRLSRVLGAAWYRSGLGDVQRVRRNLQRLFSGDEGPEELESEVRRALRLAAWNTMVVDLLPALRERHAASLLQIEGTAHLDAAIQAGQPVLLLGAHYGPFAYAVAAGLRARGYPVTQVGRAAWPKAAGTRFYRRVYWPRVERLLRHLAVRDLEVEGTDVLPDMLRLGEVPLLLPDEYIVFQPGERPAPDAMPLPLFKWMVYVRVQELRLAKGQGARLIAALPQPTGDGRRIVLAPLAAGSPEQELAAFVARLEERVRLSPGLWRDLRRSDLWERLRPPEEATI
ncbi:MAG: hypothetical protein JW900_11030 [Anaerolineae bacterium]|nr:hypothetical protein [Anaerolineae bacterium]